MAEQLTNRERLEKLLQTERPQDQPRISIYLPTHRSSPDSDQDPIVYKNLLSRAEEELTAKYHKRDWNDAMTALRTLSDETGLWTHALDGLAVLAAGQELVVFTLLYSPEPKAVVANTFHVVDLLGYMTPDDEAYLAELSRDRTRLYRVNRYSHEAFLPESIVTSFSDLFDDFDNDSNLNFGSYGGQGGMFHGHRTRAESQAIDREKYFRYLDEAFADLYKKEKRPIILAGTKENLSHFRQVANGNRIYLDDSIDQPLDSLSDAELQPLVARAMEPLLREREEKLGSSISKAENEKRVSTKRKQIKEYLEEGRVAELLIDQTRVQPEDYNLDQIIQSAMRTGAEVTVLREGMDKLYFPLTAILRY